MNSGFVSIDKDGSWVCTGGHKHKTKHHPDPVKPRNLFEVYGQQPREDARMQHNQVEEYGQQDLDETVIDHDDDDMVWVRQGVVGTTVHGYDDE
ncbi:unnamed protein product [Ilex paraguariensis]|uniref:Uncharacterized protein n=1 Tax=Ilex paraguariensis TaxID=185542 RepID=A0ABC8UN83_9AQUA